MLPYVKGIVSDLMWGQILSYYIVIMGSPIICFPFCLQKKKKDHSGKTKTEVTDVCKCPLLAMMSVRQNKIADIRFM